MGNNQQNGCAVQLQVKHPKTLWDVKGNKAKGKDNVKRERLKELSKTKYGLYDTLKTEVGKCGNLERACRQLEAAGHGSSFQVQERGRRTKYRVLHSSRKATISTVQDRRCFSYSEIDAVLLRNRREEYVELELAAKNNELGQANTPIPSVTKHGEFFCGSLGLLNGNLLQCRRCGSQSGNGGDTS